MSFGFENISMHFVDNFDRYETSDVWKQVELHYSFLSCLSFSAIIDLSWPCPWHCSFTLNKIIMRLSGHLDRHEILDKFENWTILQIYLHLNAEKSI